MAGMEMSDFRLVADGPPHRAEGRLMIPAILAIPTMFVLGAIIGEWVIGVVAFATLIGMVFIARIFWAGSRHGNAAARVNDQELVIETALTTHRYAWKDVASIEVVPFRNADRVASVVCRFRNGWCDDPVVRIRLRRALRIPWSLQGSFGPDGSGFSSGFDKQVLLSAENPHALVRAADDARHRAGYL